MVNILFKMPCFNCFTWVSRIWCKLFIWVGIIIRSCKPKSGPNRPNSELIQPLPHTRPRTRVFSNSTMHQHTYQISSPRFQSSPPFFLQPSLLSPFWWNPTLAMPSNGNILFCLWLPSSALFVSTLFSGSYKHYLCLCLFKHYAQYHPYFSHTLSSKLWIWFVS